MREKKKHDELLAETPEAWQSFPMVEGQRASDTDSGQSELHDLITRRAYEIYEDRGRSEGEAMNDWLRAEAEIRSSLGEAGQGKFDKARKRPSSMSRTGVRQ